MRPPQSFKKHWVSEPDMDIRASEVNMRLLVTGLGASLLENSNDFFDDLDPVLQR